MQGRLCLHVEQAFDPTKNQCHGPIVTWAAVVQRWITLPRWRGMSRVAGVKMQIATVQLQPWERLKQTAHYLCPQTSNKNGVMNSACSASTLGRRALTRYAVQLEPNSLDHA